MVCELCGKNDAVVSAVVEGSELVVCDKCAKFGRVVGRIKTQAIALVKNPAKDDFPMPAEVIVADYGAKIRSAREKLGKTQEDFAKLVNEKASVIHKIETNRFEPSVELTRKIERVLKLKLVEKAESVTADFPKSQKNAGLTLGDFVKIKR